jgi:DNA replication protein DnaC
MTTEKRLRLVAPSQEDRQVSPSVRELAARDFSPEQLAEMAKKHEEVKRRWTLTPLTPPARTPAPHLVEVKKQAEPLPVETEVRICPTCKLPIRDDAHGFVRHPDPTQFVKAVPCPQCSPRVKAIKAVKKMEQDLGDLFGGANIPDNAEPWEFATYPLDGDQVAKDEAWAFANKETYQRGLYLWGQLGRGKTSLAVSILKVFLQRGETGLYIRAPHYLRLVNQMARGNEKNAAILDLAYSVACLVLDDLGAEQAIPAAIRQFYELVEERRGTNGLYTVITSNLSIDDLEERWRPEGVARGEFHEGMRVTDRLRESWGDLEIQGVSLRAIHWQE